MHELPEYLRPLKRLCQPFPEEAVSEAVARREETVPHMLAALEWTVEHMEEIIADADETLSLFALFLLAQFRETRAYPTAIKMARHPQVEDLLDDIITEGFGPVLASLSGGDPEPIKILVEDRAQRSVPVRQR